MEGRYIDDYDDDDNDDDNDSDDDSDDDDDVLPSTIWYSKSLPASPLPLTLSPSLPLLYYNPLHPAGLGLLMQISELWLKLSAFGT